MTEVSCRSSNLICTITYTQCGIRYVSQTLLRLKHRFVHTIQDTHLGDKDKSNQLFAIFPNRITMDTRMYASDSRIQGLNMEYPKEFSPKPK